MTNETVSTGRRMALTKFEPPALPTTFVPRRALYASIDEGAHLPLTVVVGLPGSGKTATLTGWWNERARPYTVWISCDERDRDPVQFWSSVVAALRARAPGIGADAGDLLADPSPDLYEVVVALVNDLVVLAEPVTFVVDDFSFATPAGPTLAFFIERAPLGVRVVLGCRAAPPVELPRLRVRGLVREIRQEHLALDVAETAAFFTAYGIEIDMRQAEALCGGTDGWAAALQLAAVSVRAGSPIDGLLHDLSQSRELSDFLVKEVVERQASDVRDFVYDTSILDELDAETCDALLGASESGFLLEQVADTSLLLSPVAADGVYRYHRLFGDLLRAHLRAHDSERERGLHRRAAEQFETDGRFELAFRHLLEAHDTERALALLGQRVLAMFFGSDPDALERMLIQAETVAAHVDAAAMLDLAFALALIGRLDQAEWWIECARRHSDAQLAPPGRLALVRSVVAVFRGEAESAESLADEAARDLARDDQFAAVVPAVRIRTRLWLGDPQGAREAYEAVCDKAFSETAILPVLLQGDLAWAVCVEGALVEAEGLAKSALEAAERLGLGEHRIIVEPLRARARIAYERGELAAAESGAERALKISNGVRPCDAALDLLVLAKVRMARGRLPDAVRAVAGARLALAGRQGPLGDLCASVEARIALQLGDTTRADELASTLPHGRRQSLLRARIACRRREFGDALNHLAECRITTARESLDVGLVRARCAAELGDDAFADYLGDIAEFARHEMYVQPVVEELADCGEALARLLRAGDVGPWERRVLEHLDHPIPSASTMSDGGMNGRGLSPRELQVLRYLASRLTNAEIAQELYISLNTLRTHVAAIYRKLGVSSRRDAVEVARRLDLTRH